MRGLLSTLLLFATLELNPAASIAGTVVSRQIQSAAIAGNRMGISSLRSVLIHLPEEYPQGNQRYPVVYYLPGFGGTVMTEAAEIDRMSTARMLRPMITVMIPLEGIVFLNSPEFGRWEDFLLNELIPFVDREYRTIPSSSGRALVGASMGGLSALLLTVRHPGVWSGLGLNDASVYYTGYYELHVGREGELPQALKTDFEAFMNAWRTMPSTMQGYQSLTGSLSKSLIQIGMVLSPNAAAPLRFDPPLDATGRPVPAVLDKWRAYCLLEPSTIANNLEALKNLSTIAMVVPELDGVSTNAYQNLYFRDLLTAAGVRTARIDWPGGHAAFRTERLVALEEELAKTLAQ